MGRIVYICKGCGVATNDPAKQMATYAKAGNISCCPERNMLPAYATDGLEPPDKTTLDEVWNLAIAEAARRAEIALVGYDQGDDGFGVEDQIRRLKKPDPRSPIGRDEIMALFFRHGCKPIGMGIDNLGITPEQLYAFAMDLIVRTELRTLSAGKK